MNGAAEGEATWLSLGFEDVNASDLLSVGSPWQALAPAEVARSLDAEVARLMPTEGWREVRTFDTAQAPFRRRVFAAPHESGWALIHLAETDDGTILSGDPGPYFARPGRASRREGLRLRWSPVTRCRAAELNQLTVTLVNVADRPWAADPLDSPYVHGFLLDEHGQHMSPGWFAYSPDGSLPDSLGPSEAATLPVDFGPDVAGVEPGVYGVQAVLTGLGLSTAAHTLEVE